MFLQLYFYGLAWFTFIFFAAAARKGVRTVLVHVLHRIKLDSAEISSYSGASEYCPDVVMTVNFIIFFDKPLTLGRQTWGNFLVLRLSPSASNCKR